MPPTQLHTRSAVSTGATAGPRSARPATASLYTTRATVPLSPPCFSHGPLPRTGRVRRRRTRLAPLEGACLPVVYRLTGTTKGSLATATGTSVLFTLLCFSRILGDPWKAWRPQGGCDQERRAVLGSVIHSPRSTDVCSSSSFDGCALSKHSCGIWQFNRNSYQR